MAYSSSCKRETIVCRRWSHEASVWEAVCFSSSLSWAYLSLSLPSFACVLCTNIFSLSVQCSRVLGLHFEANTWAMGSHLRLLKVERGGGGVYQSWEGGIPGKGRR